MSVCFISQIFGKLKFGKNVKSVIWQTCQIATITLFPNLSFPNISEIKQTDMPLILNLTKFYVQDLALFSYGEMPFNQKLKIKLK